MGFEVKDNNERPEQVEHIDMESESGIVILPVYSPFSENPDQPVDATEAATIEKLWEYNGVDYSRIEGEGTLVQFSDATILPPIYYTVEFIANNPETLILALEILAMHYERQTSDEVELEMTVESEDESTSMKYSGPAEGLKAVPEKVFDETGVDVEMEEETDD